MIRFERDCDLRGWVFESIEDDLAYDGLRYFGENVVGYKNVFITDKLMRFILDNIHTLRKIHG